MKVIFSIGLFCIHICVATGSQVNTDDAVCEDHPKECDHYWTRGWYTCNNGGALWRYCPRRCGLCGKKVCEDKKKSCNVLMKHGYCNKYKGYMNGVCAKSCGFCKVIKKPKLEPGCRDYEPFCSKWIALNECVTNRETKQLCPKGCGVCGQEEKVHTWKQCKDKRPQHCNQYQCVANKNRSKKSCMKSCSMCKEDGRCYDLISFCWLYKSNGSCKRKGYLTFMSENCRYSCGLC